LKEAEQRKQVLKNPVLISQHKGLCRGLWIKSNDEEIVAEDLVQQKQTVR
jgi:hypothetical protein